MYGGPSKFGGQMSYLEITDCIQGCGTGPGQGGEKRPPQWVEACFDVCTKTVLS